jgi:hypothetical protein
MNVDDKQYRDAGKRASPFAKLGLYRSIASRAAVAALAGNAFASCTAFIGMHVIARKQAAGQGRFLLSKFR